jgi:multiple sugar transport system permease protein
MGHTPDLAVKKRHPTWRARYQRFVKQHTGFLWIAPALFMLLAVIIYPMIYGIYLSFVDKNLGHQEAPFIGLENFRFVFQDDLFRNSVSKTLIYVTTSVSLTFLFGLGLALLMQKITWGRSIFHLILISPMAIAPLVVGLTWRWIYNPLFGLLNPILIFFHLPQQAPLGSPDSAMEAVLVVDIWQWSSLAFLILYAGIASLPREPYEAADLDGAGPWMKFWRITLPMLMPVVLVVLVLRTTDAFRTFDLVSVMTAGGPALSTELMSLYIYRVGFQFFQMGRGAAAGQIMLLGAGLILAIYFRFLYQELD